MPACQVNECTVKNAHFGEPGGKPLYCKAHKLYHHVDIKNPKCSLCSKHAVYSPKKGIKPTRCRDHKTDDMINIYQNICIEINC